MRANTMQDFSTGINSPLVYVSVASAGLGTSNPEPVFFRLAKWRLKCFKDGL